MTDNRQWIYVGDRGSDIYTFWQTCEHLAYDFVIRVAQDRRALIEEEPEPDDPNVQHLKALAHSLPAQGGLIMHMPAQRQRPARDAFVQISSQEVRDRAASPRGNAQQNGDQGLAGSRVGTRAA